MWSPGQATWQAKKSKCTMFSSFFGRHTELHCSWGAYENWLYAAMWLVVSVLGVQQIQRFVFVSVGFNFQYAVHLQSTIYFFTNRSVGVILYEMLVGQPPFLATTPAETQYKVINWATTLRIPSQASLSANAKGTMLFLSNPKLKLFLNLL